MGYHQIMHLCTELSGWSLNRWIPISCGLAPILVGQHFDILGRPEWSKWHFMLGCLYVCFFIFNFVKRIWDPTPMITHHYVHVFVMATDWDLIPFFVQTRFNHFTQTQAWTQTWLEGKGTHIKCDRICHFWWLITRLFINISTLRNLRQAHQNPQLCLGRYEGRLGGRDTIRRSVGWSLVAEAIS